MKILQINSSLKTEHSYSSKLSNAIIEKLREKEPSLTLVTRNLTNSPLPYFSENHFKAFSNSDDIDPVEKEETVKLSDQLISELIDADIIVIGVPTYNLTIPSVLKSWIDFIVRAGKTFRYTADGANGLIGNKKVYLAISSGGVFSEGPRKMFNFTEPYLKAVLGFIGLTDVEAVRVEGLAIPGIKETALEKAVQNIVIQ
ncbi:FMN-dependent NADH-azoreductase [Ohtaekwangia kribbensis]|jgi:FMN-dependent NADH-azoreductase|uniref:FMN dependent NADH:quinone oxidoreductase n=1 Tax=Ohtaekwangia kribbensis TaxID=688913 RepID=A0ABW3KCS4_9BACT